MNRKIIIVLVGITILMFVFFPKNVCIGAKNGLLLWFQTVLPALLPFMILSTFMIKQNITDCVSRVVAPFFSRVFAVSKEGSYPAVIGFLSGYPIGAKTTAQVYQSGMIDRTQAQYLLGFCNNASPMFILEFIGTECMNISVPILILLIIYLSAYFSSLPARKKIKQEKKWRKNNVIQRKENRNVIYENKKRSQSVIVSLDESILDSFVTITKIGGYIILFSIFAQIVKEMLPISIMLKGIGIGFLEITTGADIIRQIRVSKFVKYIILIGMCAFGGISSIAQTASVISYTNLSMKKYIYAKIRQAIIAMLFMLFLVILNKFVHF